MVSLDFKPDYTCKCVFIEKLIIFFHEAVTVVADVPIVNTPSVTLEPVLKFPLFCLIICGSVLQKA